MFHEPSLHSLTPAALTGSVVETIGLNAAVADFPAPIGALVQIARPTGGPIDGEVIGFQNQHTLVAPFKSVEGIRRGSQVRLVRTARRLKVGDGLLGRVVNAHGHTIDGRPQPMLAHRAPLNREAPGPMDRPRIVTSLATGVRAIDGVLTCGRGQRVGIFAGSGVGKSVLLGMMAKRSDADVIVIGLVGERGREVNEFIQRDLGPEGLARSVVVVSTSSEPALMRRQAAFTATSIAEHFRDEGKNVLLLVDSVTRMAMASREIGLAAGEPPTTRGYPPSTFSLMPQLVERAGATHTGSITAYYSVLVEGDDPNEPIADTMRGLLDGHVWLSRKLASEGHFPAIDILQSLSRLMPQITSEEQQTSATAVRRLLAAYEENRDLINIGAYRKGSNKVADVAIELREGINSFLQQKVEEHIDPAEWLPLLQAIGTTVEQRTAATPVAPIAAAPVAATPSTTV